MTKPWTFDLSTGVVAIGGRTVDLTVKQGLIFDALDRVYPRAASNDFLMSNLYNLESEEPSAKIILVFVSVIRSRLRDAEMPLWIKTVWNRGYVLSETPQPDQRDRVVPTQALGAVLETRAAIMLTVLNRTPGRVVPATELLAALNLPEELVRGLKYNPVAHLASYLRRYRGIKIWHARQGRKSGYLIEPKPKLELVRSA